MKCRECFETKPTFPAGHFGGGNYRVPGRVYRSRICIECAERLLAFKPAEGARRVSRWTISDLRRIVAQPPAE